LLSSLPAILLLLLFRNISTIRLLPIACGSKACIGGPVNPEPLFLYSSSSSAALPGARFSAPPYVGAGVLGLDPALPNKFFAAVPTPGLGRPFFFISFLGISTLRNVAAEALLCRTFLPFTELTLIDEVGALTVRSVLVVAIDLNEILEGEVLIDDLFGISGGGGIGIEPSEATLVLELLFLRMDFDCGILC